MAGKKTDAKNVSELDTIIGKKISALRSQKKLTRIELSKQVGVTHQQLQKYERGINRISAGRLYEIAQALEVDIGYFFEQSDEFMDHEALKHQLKCAEAIRLFMKISREEEKNALLRFIQTLSQKSNDTDHQNVA